MKKHLIENLGNLKDKIPDDLLDSILHFYGGYGYRNPSLSSSVYGRGSEFEKLDFTLKNAPSVVEEALKSKKIVFVKGDKEFILAILPYNEKTTLKLESLVKDGTDGTWKRSKASFSSTKTAIKELMKDSVNHGNVVRIYTLSPDKERVALSKKRKADRVGMIPRKKGLQKGIDNNTYFDKTGGIGSINHSNSWARTAYFELKSKLQRYKEEKAKGKSFKNLDEFMKGLVDSGFMEVVVIDEIPYSFYDFGGRPENLIPNAKRGFLSEGMYMVYRVSNDEVYRDRWKKIAAEIGDDSFEKAEGLLPPRTIEVHYKMQGSSFIIDRVKAKRW